MDIVSGRVVLHGGREAPKILAEGMAELAEQLQRRTPTAAEREQMIALAAYYRAQKRNFASGQELEDWLEAEAELKAQFDWT